MHRMFTTISAVVLTIVSGTTLAQGATAPATKASPSGQPAAPGIMQDHQAMLASMEAAQAAAHRPGDESLSCDALKAQLVETANDPAVTAYIAAAGAAAQRDLTALQAAQPAAAGGQMAASIAGAAVPGVDMAAVAAAAAQGPAARAQTAQRAQQHMQQMQQLTAIMPKLMRGQRLTELAAIKKCDWIAGEDSARLFGAFPPGEQDQ